MSYLADTHTLIWAVFEPGRLGKACRMILEDPEADVAASPLSFWEISLKARLGKVDLPGTDPSEMPAAVEALGLDILDLSPTLLASSHRLPSVANHRDPFDRLLAWQAIQTKRVLLSADAAFDDYAAAGLRRLWRIF